MSAQQNNHLQSAVLQFLFFAQKRRPAPTRNPDVTQSHGFVQGSTYEKYVPHSLQTRMPWILKECSRSLMFFPINARWLLRLESAHVCFTTLIDQRLWSWYVQLTKWICDWFWLMVRYLFNKCHQGDEARYKKINTTKGGIVTVRNSWIFLSRKGDKSRYNK